MIRDRCLFGRLARSHGVYRQTRTRAHFVGWGSPSHVDFLKIVLTRFCEFRYKGVPPSETREINHIGRNHVATHYSVSTTSPLSSKFIQ